jgi:hypothetical protein
LHLAQNGLRLFLLEYFLFIATELLLDLFEFTFCRKVNLPFETGKETLLLQKSFQLLKAA